MTTTSQLYPPPPPMSAADAVDEEAKGQHAQQQQQQQCRRCSFLFTGGCFTPANSLHLANSTLFGDPTNGGTAGGGGKVVTAVSNASKANSHHNIFNQSQRRPSPPLLAAFFNASMAMVNGNNNNTTNSSSFIRLLPFFATSTETTTTPCSGQHSRGESSLELEALTAVHQFAIAVQNIAVSEMLPRTADLIFVNLTTLDGQPYCLELTTKGWRVTSLRSDCMQGDFTQMDTFTRYYDSLHDLMDVISPGYRERFAEDFGRRFEGLVERMQHGNQNEHSCRHSADCSSGGQMSDCECSEETATEDFAADNNCCAFCRKRLEREENGDNGGRLAENEEGRRLASRLIHGN